MVEEFFAFINNLSPDGEAAVISSVGNLLAGLTVAVFALFGIYWQLKHDREQKKIEREMDLRKTVFLDVVEAMIESLGIINKYYDLNNDDKDLGKLLTKNSAVIAKAHVIASETTINALIEFNKELGKGIMHVALKRIPLSLNKEMLGSKELIEFASLCSAESSKVGRLALPNAIAAVRNELELPLNVKNYSKLLGKNYDEATKFLDEYYVNLIETMKGAVK